MYIYECINKYILTAYSGLANDFTLPLSASAHPPPPLTPPPVGCLENRRSCGIQTHFFSSMNTHFLEGRGSLFEQSLEFYTKKLNWVPSQCNLKEIANSNYSYFYVCRSLITWSPPVSDILWCILYIVMYFFIVMCMHSWYIRPIVSVRTCCWPIYELTRTSLRHLHHIAHYCIHMSARYIVPDVLPRTSDVMHVLYTDDTIHVLFCVWCTDGSYMYLSIVSYKTVSCMIYMSYVCHTFLLTVCHATRFLQINIRIYFLQLVIS